MFSFAGFYLPLTCLLTVLSICLLDLLWDRSLWPSLASFFKWSLEWDLFYSFSLFSRDFSMLALLTYLSPLWLESSIFTLFDLLWGALSDFDLLLRARSSKGLEAALFKVLDSLRDMCFSWKFLGLDEDLSFTGVSELLDWDGDRFFLVLVGVRFPEFFSVEDLFFIFSCALELSFSCSKKTDLV